MSDSWRGKHRHVGRAVCGVCSGFVGQRRRALAKRWRAPRLFESTHRQWTTGWPKVEIVTAQEPIE